MEILWQILQFLAVLFVGSLLAYSAMSPEERDNNARAMDEFLYGEDWRD